MATRRKKRKTALTPTQEKRKRRVVERLHAMRMKYKPGYADEYLTYLRFTPSEIERMKRERNIKV
jgi:hypothetical protein